MHPSILVSCIGGKSSASNILKHPLLLLRHLWSWKILCVYCWQEMRQPTWTNQHCAEIKYAVYQFLKACFTRGLSWQSVYNFILVSSLHIVSAVIPNYAGFKTVVATVTERVSRLLSCSVVLKTTGSDILLHLCCLGLVWCWITEVVPKVVSRDVSRDPQGTMKHSQGVNDFLKCYLLLNSDR